MEIQEIKELQHRLNLELTLMISEKLEEFRSKTGLSVGEIRVGFTPTTTYSDSTPQFVIAHVDTKLVIDF